MGYLATSYPDGSVYFETDRTLYYVATAGVWQYLAGICRVTQANLPADFGTSGDVDVLAYVTDFAHLLRWNGSTWEWAPGEDGSDYVVAFVTGPDEPTGWHACDGSANVVRLLPTGARVRDRAEHAGELVSGMKTMCQEDLHVPETLAAGSEVLVVDGEARRAERRGRRAGSRPVGELTLRAGDHDSVRAVWPLLKHFELQTLGDRSPQTLDSAVAMFNGEKLGGGKSFEARNGSEIVGGIWFQNLGDGLALGHFVFATSGVTPEQKVGAVRKALKSLFASGFRKVSWFVFADNRIFQAFLRKRLNASHEGHFRKQIKRQGQFVDYDVWASFPEDIK
jgi:RimJ/RimL family protein N-acetyltransferase